MNVGARALERVRALANGFEVGHFQRRQDVGERLIAAADEGGREFAFEVRIAPRQLPQRRAIHRRRGQRGFQEPAQVIDVLSRFLKPTLATPAVDRAALRQLTGGDADFERELAATFIGSGDQALADILAALKVSDFETIRKRAHSLKGASANIHAMGLSSVASSL